MPYEGFSPQSQLYGPTTERSKCPVLGIWRRWQKFVIMEKESGSTVSIGVAESEWCVL